MFAFSLFSFLFFYIYYFFLAWAFKVIHNFFSLLYFFVVIASFHLNWTKVITVWKITRKLFPLFFLKYFYLFLSLLYGLKLISLVINVSSLTTNARVKIYMHSSVESSAIAITRCTFIEKRKKKFAYMYHFCFFFSFSNPEKKMKKKNKNKTELNERKLKMGEKNCVV